MGDVWAVAGAYEAYVGRWSRRVATEFVRWLALPTGRRWLDAGCGTGALTGTVLDAAAPALLIGVDMSRGFLTEARNRLPLGSPTDNPAPRAAAGAVTAAPEHQATNDPHAGDTTAAPGRQAAGHPHTSDPNSEPEQRPAAGSFAADNAAPGSVAAGNAATGGFAADHAAAGGHAADHAAAGGFAAGHAAAGGFVAGDAAAGGFVAGDAAAGGFVAGDAGALPLAGGRFDAVVSGLALNFVPRPERAVAEFARVAASGATVAAYVWDYADGMRMMRYFWDAAVEVDPAAATHDEGPRFPICHPEALREAWTAAGLTDVETRAIEVPTVFADFDDYWRPFLGGQGPAPALVAAMPPDQREAVRALLAARLPREADGSIPLTARAWAARGTAPR
ncbi:class I SAM-dependent methyltransferase [Actinoplanes subtropicus]|uniref:class I SAM-dependent methyltransferase n=1 Tax=Actinoplanes subtropicus TaxID=543632 RepID=UPI0012F91C7C|nr:methyltransferase domain-containing protein [Actinoplanes subtropicus]